jgi:hypothetical protein
MLRLHAGPLSSRWIKALKAFFNDIKELGHEVEISETRISVKSEVPRSRRGEDARKFWKRAHDRVHLSALKRDLRWIKQFESAHRDLFIIGQDVDLNSVKPAVELANFDDQHQRDVIMYLQRYQTVASRKLVGRRLGLLVYDEGQKNGRPLIGAALLCSSRYYQPARDIYLQWNLQEAHSEVRKNGLSRIMQLAIVCAVPPYNRLSAAWMLAALPFTEDGQEAFAKCVSKKTKDADLAAVIATTSMGITGTPFQQHSTRQLVGHNQSAHGTRSGGHIYERVEAPRPLLASFEALLSEGTFSALRALYKEEGPKKDEENKPQSKTANDLEAARIRENRAALSFFLRRSGLHRSIFDGNEMGVHVGAIGAKTLHALRTGEARADRPRVDKIKLMETWQENFAEKTIPSKDMGPEDAAKHQEAAERSRRKALETKLEDILLSSQCERLEAKLAADGQS